MSIIPFFTSYLSKFIQPSAYADESGAIGVVGFALLGGCVVGGITMTIQDYFSDHKKQNK